MNQGNADNVIMIGNNSGLVNQATNNIFIGSNAGISNINSPNNILPNRVVIKNGFKEVNLISLNTSY